ncbi:MAG: UbiA prenyltransferase family protein [Bacteroidetes bacterium]|nr:UbiA prenyltransferase family protein [Bacteroidota bacterium]
MAHTAADPHAGSSILGIFDRDTITLLRIPFSFFLLPIYVFALSQAGGIEWYPTIILFFVLHLFIYPGSNAYNSYMDQDEGSIGGLKNPPKATRHLFYASIVMDGIGLALSLLVGWRLVILIAIYIAMSKAYSWHGIRLKKYGITAWLVVVIFQGAYTFMMVNMTAVNDFSMGWFTTPHLLCMAIATLLIGGFYPLTQVYQHEEDSSRGDMTISYRLGIIGTFVFTATLFLAGNAIAWYYFTRYYTPDHFLIFNICLLPVTGYFLYWFIITLKDKSKADFAHSARMTLLSSSFMIACFSVLFYLNHAGRSF